MKYTGAPQRMRHEDNLRQRDPAFYGASREYFVVPVHGEIKYFLDGEPGYTPVTDYRYTAVLERGELGQMGRLVFVLRDEETELE